MVDIERTTEIEVELENEPGTLGEIADTLADEGINIRGFACVAQGNTGTACLVTDTPAQAVTALESTGHPVETAESLFATAPNEPGQLAELAGRLGASGVNIERSFVATQEDGATLGIGFRVDDVTQGEKVLKG